ncbi:hypothetical protein K504DRAFT_467566 [Pleomassaria siparia CBS 279.74]|uniref:Uncharacterized protein n=1 Tax=Pleomassaria siparia CBS 279.74 TaxID=1314801 RepID=A0A6G1K9V8_9PLEO|nr:hypothetical protein K504DRAFT_467566 [Pleomassaria siparia CBS 279.74]
MWTASRAPSRPSRTSSTHSVGSIHSVQATSRPVSMISPHIQRRSTGYESDASSDITDDELGMQSFPAVPNNNMPAMWQTQRHNSVSRLSQKFAANTNVAEIVTPPLRTQQQQQQQQQHHRPEPVENSPDDDSHSRASTLGGEEDYEFPEKTPTSLPRAPQMESFPKLDHLEEGSAPAPAPVSHHVPGPLESQLAALMTKLVFMERENPVVSVTPDDYNEMKARLQALEAEKKTWHKRHEALYALRDEDVENNIKIRGMLAKARRDLEAMTKLRDEDLVNVQVVRSKLSDATRQLERQQGQSGRASPQKTRPGSMIMERRGTLDLFAVAKAAALEQRALELEKRNGDLMGQLESLKGGSSIDDLNRMTAHKAWKDTVTDMEFKLKAKDAEIYKLRTNAVSTTSMSAAPSGPVPAADWHRLDAVHEEHASYREKVGGRMQALRSEKETLQKELHRKEDENYALEAKVQSLQRRLNMVM